MKVMATFYSIANNDKQTPVNKAVFFMYILNKM